MSRTATRLRGFLAVIMAAAAILLGSATAARAGMTPTAAHAAVTPNGTYSEWTWPATTTGYHNFDINLAIQGHTANARYFWSHQFGFIGGEPGYLGLQTGSEPNRTKIALFSIWGANGARDGNCGQFVEGTPGWTCRIDPYSWVTARTYRLRIWQFGADAQGEWWHAWVQDTVTGVENLIGSIRVPARWGGLSASSVSWTENFGQHADTCSGLPWARAYWAFPTANGNQIKLASHRPRVGGGDCVGYSRLFQTPSGYVQEMGRATETLPRCNGLVHFGTLPPPSRWRVQAPGFVDLGPTPPIMSNNCTLSLGDTGEYVRQLQISLAYCNLVSPGPVNGIYGPETANAVRWIQYATGNPQTGNYNQATRLAMGWVITKENGTEPRCGDWSQYNLLER